MQHVFFIAMTNLMTIKRILLEFVEYFEIMLPRPTVRVDKQPRHKQMNIVIFFASYPHLISGVLHVVSSSCISITLYMALHRSKDI